MASANEEAGPPPRMQQRSPAPSPPTTAASSTDAAAIPGGVSVDHDGTAFPSSSPPSQDCPSRPRRVSGVVPPYWQRSRALSRASQTSLDGLAGNPAITLEDHTEDPDSATSRGLWAKSVKIEDYVVVQGRSGVGAYVVWNCKIETLDGGPMTIRMRYSEFDDLRQKLLAAFPHAKNALPSLPPKSVLFKFRPSFLESRRVRLEYFFNCVLLNPEFSGSPVLKDFLFCHLG